MNRNTLYALVGLGALSLIWGYNWVVMKEALRFSGPFIFSALRCLLGALSLFVVLLILRRPMSLESFFGTLILGLLQTTGATGLLVWALVGGSAGKTAVLTYSMPFWLLVLAWPILGEHLRGLEWPAAILAFVGLFLILQVWRLHPQLLSVILGLLSGISWALSAIWVKRLRQRKRVDLLPLTAWQLLLGGIPLLLVAFWQEPQPINWTPYFVGALAYNAILGTAIAWLLWLYALQELPAGLAGMCTLFVPLIGVIAAWIQLGEVPGIVEGLGMVLILVGLAVLSWERGKEQWNSKRLASSSTYFSPKGPPPGQKNRKLP